MVTGRMLEYKVDILSGGRNYRTQIGAVYVPSSQVLVAANAGLTSIEESITPGYVFGRDAKPDYEDLVFKVEQSGSFVGKKQVDVNKDVMNLIRREPNEARYNPEVTKYLKSLIIMTPTKKTTPTLLYDAVLTTETSKGPFNMPIGILYFVGLDMFIKPNAQVVDNESTSFNPTIYAHSEVRDELRKIGITDTTPHPPETKVSVELLDWCYRSVEENNDELPLEQPVFDELMKLLLPLRYFSDFGELKLENRSHNA